LEQNLIVDLVRQISDKDVEVLRSVFFASVVGLVSPVDTNFLESSVSDDRSMILKYRTF